MLKVHNLSRTYSTGKKEVQVLKEVEFEVKEGGMLAIVGPSGSGKTTLLGLCAGLDRPTSGNVELDGIQLEGFSEDQRAELRRDKVGFIFQNFQLVPTLTALENVMVPLELGGVAEAKEQAEELLQRVGLGDRQDHYPNELSGGEQQRVSIARAFAGQPKILFADEPTGNLDEDTGGKIEDLLFELNREKGTALVLVTHDPELASRCGRILRLRGGSVIEDSRKSKMQEAAKGE